MDLVETLTQVERKIMLVNYTVMGATWNIYCDQIKSRLLSHHHSTCALVSEILESVLQTVQKQFTYRQYIQTYTEDNV